MFLIGDIAMIAAGYYIGITKGYGLVGVMSGTIFNVVIKFFYTLISFKCADFRELLK